ncbi:GH25 family lysozyme [Streptomyces fungicidicus]|uniref:GH25 family lysozyme n=1 Tax=Streptomyces fungicidicus TaxID=68203 RepID=UPI0033C995EA
MGAVAAAATIGFTVISANGKEEAQAASPAVYAVKGIDTSHHNQHPVQWSQTVKAGYSFVFHKASQGVSYKDPTFSSDFAAASRAGLMNAPYHFYSSGSGAQQAAHFIATVRKAGYDGRTPGQLPPMVDLEPIAGKCPDGITGAQVSAFLSATRAAFGVEPIVYTSKSFTDQCLRWGVSALKNSPLWQPRYRSGSNEPAPVGGRRWSIWQYTETGRVAGINGNVDVNVYRGTRTQLEVLAHLSPGQKLAPTRPSPASGGSGGTGRTTPPQASAWPLVKSGTRGADVATAQHLLTAAGHPTTVDGVFGPKTRSATIAFQKAHGLSAHGIIGPNTWNKLIKTVSTGSKGAAVKAAQTQLASSGHSIAVDGVFGPKTRSATIAFQKAHGLSADGIIGPNTWNKLIAGAATYTQPKPAQVKPSPTTPSAGGILTHAQALARLRAAGIDVTSSGNCSNRNIRTCTSFDGVRARSIDGIVALRKNSRCPITVTGGTEVGHSTKGSMTHGTGYKIDISPDACVSAYIKAHSNHSYDRGDALVRTGTIGGIKAEYAREASHWDIKFF